MFCYFKFRNSYTAWLTVLVKFDQSSHPQFTPRRETLVKQGDGGGGGVEAGKVGDMVTGNRVRLEWVVAIKRKKLMDNPHYETGSQVQGVPS